MFAAVGRSMSAMVRAKAGRGPPTGALRPAGVALQLFCRGEPTSPLTPPPDWRHNSHVSHVNEVMRMRFRLRDLAGNEILGRCGGGQASPRSPPGANRQSTGGTRAGVSRFPGSRGRHGEFLAGEHTRVQGHRTQTMDQLLPGCRQRQRFGHGGTVRPCGAAGRVDALHPRRKGKTEVTPASRRSRTEAADCVRPGPGTAAKRMPVSLCEAPRTERMLGRPRGTTGWLR